MKVDEHQLTELIVESQDLHADALRGVPAAVRELEDIHLSGQQYQASAEEVSAFNQGRRDFVAKLGLGSLVSKGVMAGGFASALAALITKPVLADNNLDIQILQTASSLEILAVATYGAALGLPFIANGNAVIKTFAMTTMNQHDQHRQAFQAQTGALGGVVQTNPNPKYAPVVAAAKPTLQTPADVVKLAATLEQVATDTYLADMSMFADTKSKQIMASVMGVECQHLATLRAVGALLAANVPNLIAIPTDVSMLPAAAGSVAFPNPTEGTSAASPPAEGAVQ
ncbi:MAG TPA: ferritin-like domain-containing protein [Chloroflexota bacterium]|nr:ferritin-like domain-containing protein [Chloroflexota bacterium]